jgi:4-amino-4-deoxy-L-arabinose transferase-like glycosyltransferase
LIAILVLAVALRAAWLVADAVPFNGDEAVVGLMAKHILQNGERPTFFYGQDYSGALDAYLTAGMYALIGPRIMGGRLVQMTLFALYVVLVYALAGRATGDQWAALVSALIVAVSSPLLATYTLVSVGGYGESLVLGTLMLWLALRVTDDWADRWLAWLTLGVAGGLAFWTLGISVVYLVPAALFIAWRDILTAFDNTFWSRAFRREKRQAEASTPVLEISVCAWYRFRHWRFYLAALAAFVAFSSPWWIYDLTHHHASLRALYDPSAPGGVSLGDRVAGFLLLGLPALFGMRFPWQPELILIPLAVLALALYLAVIVYAARPLHPADRSTGWMLLLIQVGVFLAVFIGSRFGVDATGRYLLPLVAPLAVFTAMFLRNVRRSHPRVAVALLVYAVAFNFVGTALAAWQNPPGLTTQFGPITRFDNRSDAALISFLIGHGGARGYSNYWVTYRIAYESDERVILAARLPFKEDFVYSSRDAGYAPYNQMADASPTAVYVTSQHPRLDALLRERFTSGNVMFQETQIGPYHVFYGLSRKVMPEELGGWRE